MFLAVVNRYTERQTIDHDTLEEALAEYQSEEHFFIGVIDSETLDAWVPITTALGYSKEEALAELTEVAKGELKSVSIF
jgi:hypothetical protein